MLVLLFDTLPTCHLTFNFRSPAKKARKLTYRILRVVLALNSTQLLFVFVKVKVTYLVKMSGKNNKAFTKEEELLLQDFSRNVSTKSSALFYGNAFIVSAIPICKWYLSIN